MEFTDRPLEPFGQTLLDTKLESDLGLKTALVFRIVKVLQDRHCLPPYGCNMAEVCLEEALTNSIVHGNQLDRAKKVHVIVFVDEERYGVIIEDEGSGFRVADVPDPNDERSLLRERGRGIILMTHYMDDVQYNAKGTRLRMVRKKQTRPDPGARKPVEMPAVDTAPAQLDLAGIDLTIPEVKATSAAAHVILPDDIGLEHAGANSASGSSGSPASDIDSDAEAIVLERDGVAIVRFQTSRVTQDNADAIRQALQRAIDMNTGLVLDMAEVEFMSSVGISTLIGAYKKVTAQKKKVVLASMGPALKNVLKATGLLRMFQIEPDQDAAIKKVKG